MLFTVFYTLFPVIINLGGGKEQDGMKTWYCKPWEFYFLNIYNKKKNAHTQFSIRVTLTPFIAGFHCHVKKEKDKRQSTTHSFSVRLCDVFTRQFSFNFYSYLNVKVISFSSFLQMRNTMFEQGFVQGLTSSKEHSGNSHPMIPNGRPWS